MLKIMPSSVINQVEYLLRSSILKILKTHLVNFVSEIEIKKTAKLNVLKT